MPTRSAARPVLDMDETDEAVDVVPGSDTDSSSAAARRLRALADDVDQLRGEHDAKLMQLVGIVRGLVDDGFQPIVFCRFIDTAEYVAAELRERLPNKLGVEIEAVTGRLPGAERVQRIEALSEAPKRVLVATDCLSEGINLQNSFNAVVHYDLPWNPTRLEQREGRVDRFGQVAPEVRIITYYGSDNQIDETVLDVLVRKHRKIRSALGISLPIPGDTGDVINALAENVLLRSDSGIEERLPGFDDFLRPETEQLHLAWDEAAERETRSRSIFAQETIRPAEVAAEVEAMQEAVGSGADVGAFVVDAIEAYGGLVTGQRPDQRRPHRDRPRGSRRSRPGGRDRQVPRPLRPPRSRRRALPVAYQPDRVRPRRARARPGARLRSGLRGPPLRGDPHQGRRSPHHAVAVPLPAPARGRTARRRTPDARRGRGRDGLHRLTRAADSG